MSPVKRTHFSFWQNKYGLSDSSFVILMTEGNERSLKYENFQTFDSNRNYIGYRSSRLIRRRIHRLFKGIIANRVGRSAFFCKLLFVCTHPQAQIKNEACKNCSDRRIAKSGLKNSRYSRRVTVFLFPHILKEEGGWLKCAELQDL